MLWEIAAKTFLLSYKLFFCYGTFNVLVSFKPWRVSTRFFFLSGFGWGKKTFNECSTSLKLLLLFYDKIGFLYAGEKEFFHFFHSSGEKSTELHLQNFNYKKDFHFRQIFFTNQICVKCQERNWKITNLINIPIDIDHGINFCSPNVTLGAKKYSAKIRL